MVAGYTLAASPATPRTVLLLAPRGDLLAEALLPALEGQLAGLEVRLELVPVAADGREVAAMLSAAAAAAQTRQTMLVIWATPERPDGGDWLLYMSDVKGERLLLRRVASADPATAAELAALLLRVAIVSLLEGGAIGVTAAPVRQPESPVDPQSGARGGVAVGYSGEGLAPAIPVRQALAAALWWRVGDGLLLRADYRLFHPVARATELARISYAEQRLAVGVERLGGLRVALTAGVSVARQRTTTETTGIVTQGSSLAVLAFAAPEVSLVIARLKEVEVALAAGADMFPNPRTYAIASPGGRHNLLAPWPVQPWVRLVVGSARVGHDKRSPRSELGSAAH